MERLLASGFALAALLLPAPAAAESPATVDPLTTPVGTVNFPASCEPRAAALVERGVALLHHMMYGNARFVFQLASQADPGCALAYWGHAMTLIHPLWPDRPSPQRMAEGRELARRAAELGRSDAREAAYAQTVRAYFEGNGSEAERLARFEAAWRQLAEAQPTDLEAQAFFALAHMATAAPGDKSYTKQRRAGEIAAGVLTKGADHPGAHHYTIHAYDYPGLAERALPVADSYGRLAPRVPHATHMMTHIYTRVGRWEESIEWNRKSADAAWELCLSSREINNHYPHALDYLAYAHLQRAEDDAVAEIVRAAAALEPPFTDINRDAAAYAFAALPARHALERRDWDAAAALAPRTPAAFPWTGDHDAYVALTHFARALGFARLGRVEAAAAEARTLAEMGDRIAKTRPYWGEQIGIQKRVVDAWISQARGEGDGARLQLQRAVELEVATEKSPVTPGEVLPAIELLGDLLLEQGRNEEALAAYRASLARTPGRFASLFGAGRAAEASGNHAAARAYYEALLAQVSPDASPRPPLAHARDYLSRSAS